MDCAYSIQIDARRSLVRMTLQGFFTPDDIARFDEARRLEYRRLRCPPNQHVTLIDIRGTTIQSQESVALFSRSLTDPQTRSRRVAFVVSKSLARLQIRRAASKRDVAGYFTTLEEAEQWLFDERAQAA